MTQGPGKGRRDISYNTATGPAHVSVISGQERGVVLQAWDSERAGRTDPRHVEEKMESRLGQIWGSALHTQVRGSAATATKAATPLTRVKAVPLSECVSSV